MPVRYGRPGFELDLVVVAAGGVCAVLLIPLVLIVTEVLRSALLPAVEVVPAEIDLVRGPVEVLIPLYGHS